MKKILRGLLAVMAFAVCMAGAISIPSRAEEAYTSENEAEATDAELQTTAGAELATVKNGWVNVKGGRKYYENGFPCWVRIPLLLPVALSSRIRNPSIWPI